MNKIPSLLIVILLANFSVFAQEEVSEEEEEQQPICTQNLRLARTLYEEGKLNEIPPTLSSCLRSGFTTEEKVEAYRLIAITYLYLDEPAKADEAMLNLLHTNPEYTVEVNLDPAEYINLYNSFRTEWLFRWGIKVGGLYSFPHVMENYATTTGGFSGSPGFQFGGFVELDNLVPLIKIQPEILYTSKSYEYSATAEDDEGNIGNATSGGLSTTLNLSYLELFVTGKYNFIEDKNYFASLSPGIGYLITAEDANLEYKNQEKLSEDLLEGENKDLFFRVNPQLFIGAGTEFKFGRFYAVAEVRYGYSFKNLVKNRYASPSYNLQNNFVVSDHKLNVITFSISFMRASYNPRKLTN